MGHSKDGRRTPHCFTVVLLKSLYLTATIDSNMQEMRVHLEVSLAPVVYSTSSQALVEVMTLLD